MGNKTPRALTVEEAQNAFMTQVAYIAREWANYPDKTAQERCSGVAFSILSLIDGCSMGYPRVRLLVDPHPADREYHRSHGENWYEPDQAINDDAMLHEQWCHYEKKMAPEV